MHKRNRCVKNMDQLCIYETMTFKTGRELLTMVLTGEQLYYNLPMYMYFHFSRSTNKFAYQKE